MKTLTNFRTKFAALVAFACIAAAMTSTSYAVEAFLDGRTFVIQGTDNDDNIEVDVNGDWLVVMSPITFGSRVTDFDDVVIDLGAGDDTLLIQRRGTTTVRPGEQFTVISGAGEDTVDIDGVRFNDLQVSQGEFPWAAAPAGSFLELTIDNAFAENATLQAFEIDSYNMQVQNTLIMWATNQNLKEFSGNNLYSLDHEDANFTNRNFNTIYANYFFAASSPNVDDSVTISGLVTVNIDFYLSGGGDYTRISGVAHGNLRVRDRLYGGGAIFYLLNLEVRGDATFEMPDGDADVYAVQTEFVRNLNILTQEGDDYVLLYNSSVGKTMTADLGPNRDSLRVSNSSIKGDFASFDGGKGTDTLSLYRETIRKLTHTGFENVFD